MATPFELFECVGGEDERALVEADLLDALQPLTRVVGRTDERHLGALGEASWFGPVAKIDNHIGEDGVAAAGLAIEAHAVFEILPATVEAGSNPALALFRGIGDPSRVAPGAEQHRGAA